MIEVENLYFRYPNGVEALKGVSLTIKCGEFVAIMGQNGAGKTTLVKHFNGLLKPSEGTVRVDGVETTKTSVAALARNAGFVFQNPDHQLFSETVEDEISFAPKNFGFDEETIEKRITWALNLLGLAQYRKTSPFLLSGGERKRVALASVLAWNPETLILDEPTIGQDYQQKEKLRQFIVQMQAQGKTVVIVTHDVEFVAECNPRVLLMKEGTELGLKAKEYMDAGKLVPDDVIIGLVKERIKEPDCGSGFLFDGFPRTIPQADAMKEAGVPIEAVVDIDVPDEEIIKRMSGRRVHLASGRTYHIVFNPPKEEGKDDETGEPLIQRDDDKEETVRKRLDVYHAQTEPLVGYYKDWEESGESAAPKYIRIDGVGKVDEIRDQIFVALDGLK